MTGMHIIDLAKYSNLKFVGDLHGDFAGLMDDAKESHDTIYLVAGDMSLGVRRFEEDVEMLEHMEYSLAKNNNVMCMIRGNHDNPKYFKRNSTFRDILKEEAQHIYLIPDYYIIRTQNHNILCVGGARSIDRSSYNRTKDYNMWANEGVKKPEDGYLELAGNEKIDIILSHTAPLFASPVEFHKGECTSKIIKSYSLFDKTIKNDIYKERQLLSSIYDTLNDKHHVSHIIYSHYHKSEVNNFNKTKCVSLKEKEIIEL